jgi:deazaflavin-dependent oxidoreductase (nitroreductase family)
VISLLRTLWTDRRRNLFAETFSASAGIAYPVDIEQNRSGTAAPGRGDEEIALGFDTTRKGTRGARQPRGTLLNWANRMTIKRIRDGKSGEMLVLTTVGRKTGATRETPVRSFPGGDGAWLIVASANGAAANPAWYYNLAANPDVTIEIGGRKVSVTATQLAGAEREQAWQQISDAAPRFAGYQKKTDRELPVIRLAERAA